MLFCHERSNALEYHATALMLFCHERSNALPLVRVKPPVGHGIDVDVVASFYNF